MSWFSKAIDRSVKAALDEKIADVLAKALPTVVAQVMEKGFIEKPDRPLTRIGYLWAFALAMEKKWPDVDHYTAAKWCEEEHTMAGVTIGQEGYEWTARAAQKQVNEYVAAYGEAA
jgi:hypothetical protein